MGLEGPFCARRGGDYPPRIECPRWLVYRKAAALHSLLLSDGEDKWYLPSSIETEANDNSIVIGTGSSNSEEEGIRDYVPIDI